MKTTSAHASHTSYRIASHPHMSSYLTDNISLGLLACGSPPSAWAAPTPKHGRRLGQGRKRWQCFKGILAIPIGRQYGHPMMVDVTRPLFPLPPRKKKKAYKIHRCHYKTNPCSFLFRPHFLSLEAVNTNASASASPWPLSRLAPGCGRGTTRSPCAGSRPTGAF